MVVCDFVCVLLYACALVAKISLHVHLLYTRAFMMWCALKVVCIDVACIASDAVVCIASDAVMCIARQCCACVLGLRPVPTLCVYVAYA